MHPDVKFQVYSSMMKQRQQESDIQQVLRKSRAGKARWADRLLSLVGVKLIKLGKAAQRLGASQSASEPQPRVGH